jgi:Rap1a immunity proteins
MRSILLSVLTALTITTAAAQDNKSANDVLRYCKLSPREALIIDTSAREFGYCLGALDGLVVGRWRRRTSEGPRYLEDPGCFDVPDQAFIQRETLKVVITYADRHPEELTQPFVQVAARALREAWPCKK